MAGLYGERILKGIEVLAPVAVVAALEMGEEGTMDGAPTPTSTPQEKTHAIKRIVHSLSQLASLPDRGKDYNDYVGLTLEHLLACCNDSSAEVRVAADEGLNHLLNELHSADAAKIQIELFKEVKRNASPRRVRAAIVRFAELAHLIKPQKCRVYVMNLLPLLITISGREEESIQECLTGALPKIVTVLGPFFSEGELFSFLSHLFTTLVSKVAASRRMSAECITSLCHSCLKPGIFYSLSIERMLLLCVDPAASHHSLIGGFLGLRKILGSLPTLPKREEDRRFFNSDHIAAILLVILRALSHSDHNVLTAALSTLQTLIEQTRGQMGGLLRGSVVEWQARFQGRTLDDFMVGTRHTNKNMLLSADSREVEVEMGAIAAELFREEDEESLIISTALLLSHKFLVGKDGEQVRKVRVSVKSLVLSCLTELTVISPSLLPSHLSSLPEIFRKDSDPVLQGNMMALCGTYILHHLQGSFYQGWSGECDAYIDLMIASIGEDSQKVHKSCCDAAKICVGALMKTSHSGVVIRLVESLLTLHTSSYWLVKTALLEVLREVDFAVLGSHTAEPAAQLQRDVIDALFLLLADEDLRVQAACALTIASLVEHTTFTRTPLALLTNLVRGDFVSCYQYVNPPTYAICLPSDASQRLEAASSPLHAKPLSRLLNTLLERMVSSHSDDLVKGCIETFACLSARHMSGDTLKIWSITVSGEGTAGSSSGLLSFFTHYLTSTMLMYDISCHQNLLSVITALLGATCKLLITSQSYTNDTILSWQHLRDEGMVEIVKNLVFHSMKVLNICSHVCTEEEPSVTNIKDKVSVATIKRRVKEGGDDGADVEQAARVGNFTHLPHYMKLFENLKASYEAHKVSLDLQSDEKFVLVLRGTLTLLQEILKYSSLRNVGAFSEEINEYLEKLLKKEPIQCVTTTRYLLAALFGTNVICTTRTAQVGEHARVNRPVPLVPSTPLHVEFFKYSPYVYNSPRTVSPDGTEEEDEEETASFASKLFGRKFQRGVKKKPEKKEPDGLPVMQNYIRFFESVVMKSLELYTITNDTPVQGEILVLLIDLLRLRINYSLLDTGKIFVNFLLKQFEYIEQGQVRAASKLLPTLFQFLIMLTKERYQEEAVIDIPRIMQLCGTAMASGQLDTASISVSLYPLIHELFAVQGTRPETATQREVVESILLKNVIHYQVIDILWMVLHWYSIDPLNYKRYSAAVWSAVSIAISQGRLDVSSHPVVVSMKRLLDVIALSTSQIISTLLDFLGAAESEKTRCAILSLLLRYILLAITKGGIEEVVGESGDALLSTIGDAPPLQNKLLSFVLWSLRECLAYLQRAPPASTPPHSALSSLNYIHKLVHYFERDPALAASQLLPDITDTSRNLSTKYPALALTVHNIIRALGEIPEKYADTTIVGMFLKESEGEEKRDFKSILVEIKSAASLDLDGFVEKIVGVVESGMELRYATSLFLCNVIVDFLVAKLPELGELSEGTVGGLEKIRAFLSTTSTTAPARDIITVVLEKGGVKGPEQGVVNTALTSEALHRHFVEQLTVYPAEPLKVVPVLREMPLHDLRSLTARPSFDPALFLPMLEVGRRELCAQKSACIAPDEPVPPLPSLLLVGKSQLLERLASLTGVKTPTKQTTAKPSHTHTRSTSLPKSLALFVDTSAFSDPSLLLTPSPTWSTPRWQHDLRSLTRATSALLTTATLYPDLAYLNPYHIHSVTRVLALSLAAATHLHHLSRVSTCTELLELLLAVTVTRDTCAILHYGEEMGIVENVYEVLSALFGKYLSRSSPEDKTEKIRVMVTFVLYNFPTDTQHSRSLLTLVQKCIMALASLPCVSSYLRIPSYLAPISPAQNTNNTEFNLSSIDIDLLRDSEVLEDFLYRNLSFGWATKRQFEELWVTLLGMITYTMDAEMEPEIRAELSVVNRLAIRGMTVLLLQTLLTPVPGSPRTSIYQHFPRTQQIPFLTTAMGQRMVYPHKLVFDKLLACSRIVPSYQPCFPDLNIYIDSDFTQCLIDMGGSEARSIDKYGVFLHDLNRVPGSSAYYHGYYSATALRERIITNDITDLDNSGLIERSAAISADTSDEPDILSCLQFLVDLFREWTLPDSNIPASLLNQIIDSVSQLSDLFQKTHHCQWMVDGLLQILLDHPLEDSVVHAKLLYTLSKAVSLLQADKAGEKLLPFVEEALASDSVILQISALNGSFFLLESQLSCFEEGLVEALAEYVLSHLSYNTTAPFTLTATTWAVAVILLEKFQETCPEGFSSFVLQYAMQCTMEKDTPFLLYQLVTRGLQKLILAFCLPSSDIEAITQLTTTQLGVDDPQKCLSSFGLLMTCMYSGREGSRVMQLERDQGTTDQLLAGAMDKMRKVLDCVGQCCEVQALPLAAVLCYLVTDFFPTEQMINTFVSEFLSPRQENRQMIALIIHDLFQGIIGSGNFAQIAEWVLLVLRNFVHLQPRSTSTWSTAILLLCSITNPSVRQYLPYIVASGEVAGDWFVLVCREFAAALSDGERGTFVGMMKLGAEVHGGHEYQLVSDLLSEFTV